MLIQSNINIFLTGITKKKIGPLILIIKGANFIQILNNLKALHTMKQPFTKHLLLFIFIVTSIDAYAGIDYSQYGDGPIFFLGWEKSIYFGIAAFILFGISWVLSEHYKDEHGNINGGCLLISINVAMIICAICSFYVLIPLGIIWIFLKSKKK